MHLWLLLQLETWIRMMMSHLLEITRPAVGIWWLLEHVWMVSTKRLLTWNGMPSLRLLFSVLTLSLLRDGREQVLLLLQLILFHLLLLQLLMLLQHDELFSLLLLERPCLMLSEHLRFFFLSL